MIPYKINIIETASISIDTGDEYGGDEHSFSEENTKKKAFKLAKNLSKKKFINGKNLHEVRVTRIIEETDSVESYIFKNGKMTHDLSDI